MVKIVYHILFLGSGDYTPIDMPVKISMSTAIKCVNISTMYDDNPMNMDEAFIVSLTSNDTKVFIPEESANTTVIIENSNNIIVCILSSFSDSNFLCSVFPPDIEPVINKVTQGMNTVFTVKFSSAIASNGFQWQHNGKNITGENARMMNLTIVNAAEMNKGDYTCIVTFSSFEGSITSNRAQLLVCKLVFIKHDHMHFNNNFLLILPNSFTS